VENRFEVLPLGQIMLGREKRGLKQNDLRAKGRDPVRKREGSLKERTRLRIYKIRYLKVGWKKSGCTT